MKQHIFCVFFLLFAYGYCQNIFAYGVTAADPLASSVVLWTRAEGTSIVSVQISTTPTFDSIVQQLDNLVPLPENDFTVQVLVSNLTGSEFWYRFKAGEIYSDVGRFKLLPPTDQPANLRFVWSGDADGTKEDGEHWYETNFELLNTAVRDNPDFFAFLGDTIYADSVWIYPEEQAADEIPEYWARYKENRGYEAMRNILKAAGVYATWDDHEVGDNWYNRSLIDEGRYAFLNYFPIGNTTGKSLLSPTCVNEPFFRAFQWGSDIDIIILDERSCRSVAEDAEINQYCLLTPDFYHPFPTVPDHVAQSLVPSVIDVYNWISWSDVNTTLNWRCREAIFRQNRTMLGQLQKQAFFDALKSSTAKFKIVMHQLPIQEFLINPYDRWEGFPAERKEVLEFIRDNGITNVVFMATDIHQNMINNIYLNASNPNEEPIASEFVVGPIACVTPIGTIAAEVGSVIAAAVSPLVYRYMRKIFEVVKEPFCRNIDTYTYSLVEYDATTKSMHIVVKDVDNNVIRDDERADVTCDFTL